MKPKKELKKWIALETSLKDDLSSYWGGDWGCDSEVGTLRAVLLRRPGKEIENIKNPKEYRWLDIMNPELAREQHDALSKLYRSFGISVHYVERMREDKANALFMRDSVLMTPEGAIIGRQAMECRRGEERYAAEALAVLGVPIIRTISGAGIFETACLIWIDAETVLIGTGNRANSEGCRQIEEALRPMGVENFLHLQIPYGYAHIDSIVSFIDKKIAIIDPARIPWDIWNALRQRDIKLLEAPSPEETQNLGLNIVALKPRFIVMASGNPITKNFLKNHGIQVTELDVSEILKGWGSLHCMTAVLKRDPVGKLS